MNAQNPKHTAGGSIDLEIQHPEFGLIPFTASPDDEEQFGRYLYARAISGEFGAIAPRDLIPNPRLAEIDAALSTLDTKRVRPLAEGDAVYLASLNARIVALREERKTVPAMI